MSVFTFKYEKILSLRKEREDEIKNELAIAIQKLTKIEEAIQDVLGEIDAYNQQVNEEKMNKLDLVHLKQVQKNSKFYHDKLYAFYAKRREVKREIEEIRERLKEALQKRKVMEKLREKEFDKFISDVRKKERQVVDEIVNYKNYKTSGDDYGQ